jgi:hypothetical protein
MDINVLCVWYALAHEGVSRKELAVHTELRYIAMPLRAHIHPRAPAHARTRCASNAIKREK